MAAILQRWTHVRPDERRLAFHAFAAQLLLGAGHAELETARDTAFLSSLPAGKLPLMYLAVAVVGILMTEAHRRSLLKRRPANLSAFLLFGALATASFTLLAPSTPAIYALYLWTALCAPWALLQLSLQLASMLSVEQAKRLLGFIGAGSVLGAVLGSGIARAMLEWTSVRALLFSAAGFFVCAGVAVARLGGSRREPVLAYRTTRTEASDLLRNRYGRGLLLLMLSSTIAFTLVDYLFKSEVSRVILGGAAGAPRFFDGIVGAQGGDGPHRLAMFLSSTQVITNLLSLLVQVIAVAGILHMVGAHAALLLLPAFLLGGVGMFAIGASFVGALALRGVDGALRYSVHRTAIDILYFPLPDGVRRRMKPVLEILGQRGGQALAALALLAIARLPEDHTRWPVLGLLLGMLVVWTASVLLLRQPYVELFKAALISHRSGALLRDRELALPVLEAALASLNSQSPLEVIAALDLLSGYRQGRLLPALILYHPDEEVLVHALSLFAENGRDDVLPLTARLLEHPSEAVRTSALRAQIQLAPDRAQLERLVADREHPKMAATALIGLTSNDWIDAEHAERWVREWAMAGRSGIVAPLARAALSSESTPRLARVLVLCLRTAATQSEQAIVAEALAKHPTLAAKDDLIALLAFRTPRESARAALLALGEPVLGDLVARLANSETPHALRRHLPETIRRFAPELAAPYLLTQLERETDGMVRFKLLRSLNRLRREHPHIELDEATISQLLQNTLDHLQRLTEWHEALRAEFAPWQSSAEPGYSLLSSSLELLLEVLLGKEKQTCERALRLVNLLLPREDFRPIVLGLRSRIADRRASALEVLSSALPLRLREQVLAAVRHTFLQGAHREPTSPDAARAEQALRELVTEATGTLRALALHTATELDYPWVREIWVEPAPISQRRSEQRLYESARALHDRSSGVLPAS